MSSLDQLKLRIQGNPVLRAALSDGSIQIVYKDPPVIDESGFFRTWTVVVLIVDDNAYNDLIIKSLESLGFDCSRRGDQITGTLDDPITASERKAMDDEATEKREVAKAAAATRREDLLIATLEAMQSKIDELEEKLELVTLVKPKAATGPAGAPGTPGTPGRDGRDIEATDTRLQDLQDVSDGIPKQGNVLMYQEKTDSWELRFPPQSGGSLGGGGGGGGGTSLTVQSRNRENLTADPTNIVANVSAISFDTDSGFVVEDLGDGTQEAFVKLNSTFNPWLVDGQPTLDATGEEPVQFVGGSGISITTDHTADPKQIIFRATGGGGGFEEAPLDGKYYVRQMGSWIELPGGGTPIGGALDGGDFDTGLSIGNQAEIDGGDFDG